jgi:tetratricopeptide (TPR) repeat protein
MSDTDHPDDEDLFELLVPELSDDAEDLEETASHVSQCIPCTKRVEELQTLSRVKPDPAKLREGAAMDRLIRAESAAATDLLGELLTGPSQWWRTRVLGRPDAITYGFAVALVKHAIGLLNTSPVEALEAGSIAVAVSERLRVDAYPFDLVITARANAWREHAYTLFYIGRLDEAMRAIDVAERLVKQTPKPEMDLARTELVRASVLYARDRVAEAIALAEHAGEIFEELGDRPGYVKARMTEGTLRYRGGDMAGALTIWLGLENDPIVQEAGTLGLLLHNIGHAYRDMGEFARARTYLERAIAEYEARGMDVEMVRMRWVAGQMLVLAGDTADGLRVLQQTRREFERLGMELEAGLVGLEMAEALLIKGDTESVARICRTVLDRFVQQGMTSRAITALAYLREAVAVEKATPALLREMRDFLRALPQNPGSTVAPPPL